MHLAAQEVEVLRRGGGVADLDVVLGAEGEEALDASRRVLRSLALVAVGEQHDEAGGLVPLVLGGDDELVDDDLGAVHEVAELRLPDDEGVLVLDRVAVLEAEGGELRQQRVVDPELRAVACGSSEREDLGAGVVVDERGVAVREGAAAAVLAGDAHRDALVEEGAEGEGLAERPVDLAVGLVHLATGVELLGQLRVDREAVGHVVEGGEHLVEVVTGDAGLDVGEHAQYTRSGASRDGGWSVPGTWSRRARSAAGAGSRRAPPRPPRRRCRPASRAARCRSCAPCGGRRCVGT